MATIRRKRVVVTTSGSDGSATGGELFHLGRPGILRFVAIDYSAGQAATTDVVLKRDSSTGAAMYTRDDSATDLPITALGTAGIDEGQAGSAATDALGGGLPFSSGIYVDVHDADGSETATVDLYYEVMQKKSLTLTTDGSGAATLLWTLGRPFVIRAIEVDYSASAGSSMTMTFNRDALNGTTIFTKGSAETDFGPTIVGAPGLDEAGNALAATDSAFGGLLCNSALGITIASGGSAKTNVVHLWYDA